MLVLTSGNRVVDCENIGRVDVVLDLFLPVNGHLRDGSVNELFADFAYAVMVGDAASTSHNFVTRRVFHDLVLFDDAFSVQPLVHQSQVDVNGSSCVVQLSNAEGHPHAVIRETLLLSHFVHACSHPTTQFGHVRPGARSFEGLPQGVVIHGNVTHVSNQESEQVATHSILWTTYQTVKAFPQIHNGFVRVFTPLSITFKKHGACNHLVRVESFDFGDKEFLGRLDKVFPA